MTYVYLLRFFIVGSQGEMIFAAYPTTEFGFDRGLIDLHLQKILTPLPEE